VAAVMEFKFMAGSMGSVVGEKITRAANSRSPSVSRCWSSARREAPGMQEGALSLMQMAKISAALGRLHEARIPFISILADPTTGASQRPTQCSVTSSSPSRAR